jgi:hypothetical protein
MAIKLKCPAGEVARRERAATFRRLAPRLSMLALAMAMPLMAHAEEAPAPTPSAAPASGEVAPTPKVRRAYRPPRPLSAEAALDQRIHLLSVELGLDDTQQAGVREALITQRQQTLKVWQDTSIPAPLRIKVTQDIGMRTADRIRALLTDAQREKYIKPRPGEPDKAHGDDAETWIGRMHGP